MVAAVGTGAARPRRNKIGIGIGRQVQFRLGEGQGAGAQLIAEVVKGGAELLVNDVQVFRPILKPRKLGFSVADPAQAQSGHLEPGAARNTA